MFNTQFLLRLSSIFLSSALLISLASCQEPGPERPVPTALPGSQIATARPSRPSAATSTALATTSPAQATATDTPAPADPTPTTSPTPPARAVLLFTGVIVPARCVQAALDENGNPDYPYEEVRSVISEADLAIGTLNATISDYPPHTGCVPTYVLVGSSNNADAMQRAGFDVMSVATNHIKNCGLTNCGNRAFFDTLENLDRVGIKSVGAGKNLEQALEPVVVTINGVRFGFISQGQIEPMAFAGDDRPGIAVLNDENITKAIAAAKADADVVIALPHWGPEDAAVPTWIQRNLANKLVEAGADIVVGNHTHVVQGIQEIDGVPVFYGLGNFVFDQGLRDHRQGAILLLSFEGSRYLGYEIIPTHVDPDGRVHIAGPEEADEILSRIQQVSEALR